MPAGQVIMKRDRLQSQNARRGFRCGAVDGIIVLVVFYELVAVVLRLPGRIRDRRDL